MLSYMGRQLLKNRITYMVTESIVYYFEMVYIKHDQGKGNFMAFRPTYLLHQHFIEFQSVNNTCQRIGRRLTLKELIGPVQRLIGLLLFRNIIEDKKHKPVILIGK